MIRSTHFVDPAVNTPLDLVVPGQYTYTLFTLSATLDTSSPTCLSGLASDSSGNGNDGTYEGCNIGGVTGLISGNFAIDMRNQSNLTAYAGWISVPPGFIDPTAPTSLECWFQWEPAAINTIIFDARDVHGTNLGVQLLNNTHVLVSYRDFGHVNRSVALTSGIALADGTPHQLVVVWDYPDIVLYIDGALQDTASFTSTDLTAVPDQAAIGAAFSGGVYVQHSDVILDEWSFFNLAIGAGDVNDHYTAGLIDFTAYETAIANTGPICWYHLDETGPPTSDCTVILEVTDGTNVLANVTPAGTQPQNTVVTYTWVSQANAVVPVTLIGVTFVSMPLWTLPAGYHLTAVILGTPYYQWSDITLLYDDGAGFDEFPPTDFRNILLVP
jgi:hypothetical protein